MSSHLTLVCVLRPNSALARPGDCDSSPRPSSRLHGWHCQGKPARDTSARPTIKAERPAWPGTCSLPSQHSVEAAA